MNNILKAITAMAGVIAFGTTLAPYASAGCGSVEGLRPAAFSPVFQGRSPFVLAADRSSSQSAVSIVGLWKITFTSKGSVGIPDGTPIDAGYATWHSDGTELMNSGRPPITSSFCMGTWVQTGKYTYVLNHYALSWDSTGAVFLGPTNIRENITLDDSGTGYSGTFTITQYDTNGYTTATVNGVIAALRITVDTTP